MTALERMREEIARTSVPWNDARKLRVRARVLAGRPPVVRAAAGFGWITLASVGALTLAIGVLAGRFGGRPAEPAARAITTLALPGQAVATLGPDAQVEVTAQSNEAVELMQRSGHARYDVPSDGRRFHVRVGTVALQVLGTVFSVDVDGPRVSVDVDRGIVHLRDGRSEHVLVAGQRLSVPLARRPEPAPLDPAPVVIDKPAPPAAPERDLDRVLARVDAYRRSGELSAAAELLDRAVRQNRHDARVPVALFTLGRVQRARGLFRDAALAFRRCWQAAPQAALAGDAHAQEARAWAAAQDRGAAERAARAYLRVQPGGPHADEMRKLLD